MSTNLDNIDEYKFNVAKKGIFKDVNPPMATMSKILVFVFVAAGAVAPEMMGNFFSALQDWIKTNLGWYYILAMCLFMFFVFWLIVTPYGHIKLGGDDQSPDFGNFAWFSMLFGAGMGIGLLFWSVAEPMYHIQNSPFLPEGSAGLIEAVNQDISKPLFVVIQNLGTGWFGTAVMSIMALILFITYFVTSSDSGTLVVTTLISMGQQNPPISYRVFWGIGEGAVAAILLYAGGLKALQTATLAIGAPFSIIMMYTLIRSFREELAAPAYAQASGSAQ